MKNRLAILGICTISLLLSSFVTQAEDHSIAILNEIDTQRMMRDINMLSGPQFQGRQAGTIGGQRSAEFVRKRLENLGLIPAGELQDKESTRSWLQPSEVSASQFPHTVTFTISPHTQHLDRARIQPTLGSDFLPILDSPSVNVTAPVVFVGYGIDDSARGINDYEGINVQNRIVMFLRGKPNTYSKWITHEEKEQTARRRGAAGFITLTGPILNRYEARRGIGHAPLAMYSSSPDERPLPGVWISGALGEKLFTSQGHSLKNIQRLLNEGTGPDLSELGILTHLQWDSTNTPGKLTNVLAMIPGRDPILQEESILIAAHRDHFGTQAGLIFPGADDNASGTALLLELTRILAEQKIRPKRTIVFASFDGEERGLLGSNLYVDHPSHLLHKMKAMINVDHVGVGNGQLTVGVTRLSKEIGKEAANLAGLLEKTKLYGYFPGGDHVPFFKAGVPTVTVVSSGPHHSFHQPTDTAEKIQPEILQNAARYILALASLLANSS